MEETVTESVVETVTENISKRLNSSVVVPAAVGVLCLGGGLALGYILGRRAEWKIIQAEREAEEVAKINNELEELRARRREREAISEANHPAGQEPEVVNDGKAFVDQIVGKRSETVIIEPIVEEKDEPAVIRQSVFAQSDDTWNYDKEVLGRNDGTPYVIHKDEFYANELDFNQRSFTYFAGDNIMVDEDEVPIYNYERVVGDELKFGHGSGDPKVVYIRSMKAHSEYEIMRHEGLYAVEIAGLNADDEDNASIQHSMPVPKFRQE